MVTRDLSFQTFLDITLEDVLALVDKEMKMLTYPDKLKLLDSTTTIMPFSRERHAADETSIALDDVESLHLKRRKILQLLQILR